MMRKFVTRQKIVWNLIVTVGLHFGKNQKLLLLDNGSLQSIQVINFFMDITFCP